MFYIENPKTKGSGIICAIPQKGICPVKCGDCFFQSGRSYLEPLENNLPNMPTSEMAKNRVVRVNDGNDSNNSRELVIQATLQYENKFYNTSIPLLDFPAPVVLTVNPGQITDNHACLLDEIPQNLMFVRVRTNTWNVNVVINAVNHYTSRGVPVVLTFMAYYSMIVKKPDDYEYKKRTINSYWAIKQSSWDKVCDRFKNNPLVYTCGKDANTHQCSRCGNCLREYFAAMERMKLRGDK